MDTIVTLLRKIHRLMGDPGASEGERSAASKALNSKLKKLGITIDDLHDEQRNYVAFNYSGEQHRVLLLHIYAMITNSSRIENKTWRVGNRSFLSLNLTPAQEIEMKRLVPVYVKAFRKERKLQGEAFLKAFICRNGLIPETYDDDGEMDIKGEELDRVLNLARAMDPVQIPRKQIE
jgi:hypothetical protein